MGKIISAFKEQWIIISTSSLILVYSFCIFWTDKVFKIYNSDFLNHIQLSEIVPFTIHTFGVTNLFLVASSFPLCFSLIIMKPLLDEWDKLLKDAEGKTSKIIREAEERTSEMLKEADKTKDGIQSESDEIDNEYLQSVVTLSIKGEVTGKLKKERANYKFLKRISFVMTCLGIFIIFSITYDCLKKYKENQNVLEDSFVLKTEKEEIACVKILNNSPSSLTVIDCSFDKVATIYNKQIVSFEKITKNE